MPWPVTLLCAGMTAGLFGIIVGFPSLRLKGPYLAIATMGFGIA
jgi:branched-chain amino acid transport system permease protein